MRSKLIVVALLLIASSAGAADFKQVDRLVQPLLDADAIVGCVVGIVDGNTKQVRGYGSVHRGAGDRPAGDTIYEIGSMTKAFTGTLLADMSNRGEVKLDAPLQDFMPKGVKLHLSQGRPIRLVDLASQTSGLPRLPNNMNPKDPGNPYADYSAKQMFEFMAGMSCGDHRASTNTRTSGWVYWVSCSPRRRESRMSNSSSIASATH